MEITEINGVQFIPLPGIEYKSDYVKINDDIIERKVPELPTYREVILNDLWFILTFVLKIPGTNHPFVIKACRDVESGVKSNTLDVWAREHFKSTIITQAETIQDILKNPNESICILSYARAPALKLLRTIKDVFESSPFLKDCFPDILYREPAKEAFKWAEEGGLYVRRNTFRKEATLEAWGLIDGQPTGSHFDKLVYDDVVTDEVSRSPEMIQKVKRAFDMSINLGTATGRRRVVGTYYHHDDPLVYIRDMVDKVTGKNVFITRRKAATDTGEANGNPVLLSEKRLAELRAGDSYIFNCQQLLNPTPISDIPLSPDALREVEIGELPKDLWKFMVVDPAGMQTDTKKRGDAWAMMVIGVKPYRDDVGASDIYIIDAAIESMTETEAMDSAVSMYTRNGRVLKLGVEKVGLSTMEIHIAKALHSKGLFLSIESGNLVILRPSGRPKQTRIERSLSWPLSNGKVHVSKAIPAGVRERLKLEMEKFPYWHDDGLDALSYVYDIIKDYTFGLEPPAEEKKDEDLFDKYMRKFRDSESGRGLKWMEM